MNEGNQAGNRQQEFGHQEDGLGLNDETKEYNRDVLDLSLRELRRRHMRFSWHGSCSGSGSD